MNALFSTIQPCSQCQGIVKNISLFGNYKRTIVSMDCKCGRYVEKYICNPSPTAEEKKQLIATLISEWNTNTTSTVKSAIDVA